ncbi:MAG TPA: hypothetical protein VKM72_20515 [Thermoanaerobaculia bacterium]|nr:hypothetical protein [Thermoanaerobaculia bacterium]
MLGTIWNSLLSLLGFFPQGWIDLDPQSLSSDLGHEMDPNG